MEDKGDGDQVERRTRVTEEVEHGVVEDKVVEANLDKDILIDCPGFSFRFSGFPMSSETLCSMFYFPSKEKESGLSTSPTSLSSHQA